MQAEPVSVVIVVKGLSQVSSLPLTQSTCVLGRSTEADIPLENAYVSGHHAKIVREGSAFRIEDLGSKNGTFVNGGRVGEEGRRLRNGDHIELSSHEAVLEFRERGGSITQPLLRELVSELHVDPLARDVRVRGEKLDPPLSPKKFAILHMLYQQRGAVCSRGEIAAAGWPEREGGQVSNQEIDQYIRRVRVRIEEEPSRPKIIATVRGCGYRLSGSTRPTWSGER